MLAIAAAGSAAPPDSSSLQLTHTVLDTYDTDDGPATAIELNIADTGANELYDLTLDFDLHAPPPPNRNDKIDDRAPVRTFAPGETVNLFWVLTLRRPMRAQEPLIAALRAVDTVTLKTVWRTQICLAGGAR